MIFPFPLGFGKNYEGVMAYQKVILFPVDDV
jgi:hypothetical protein